MSHTVDERDLRAQVRTALLEDGGDYGDYGPGDWGGGYGGGEGFSGSFYKVLVEPFVDVGKVALASVEDISSKARRTVETSIQGLMGLVLPGVEAEFADIKKAEKARAQELRQKYGEVFQRIDASFEGDALGFAFMLAPAQFIAAMLAKRTAGPVTKGTAEALLALVDTASGRLDTVVSLTDKARKKLGLKEGGGKKSSGDDVWASLLAGESRFLPRGSILSEKTEDDAAAKVLRAVLKHPAVKNAFKESEALRGMKEDAQALVNASLNKLLSSADKIASASDLQQLGSLVGKQLVTKQLQSLQGEERTKAETAVVAQLKKGMLSAYVSQLKREVKSLQEQGLDSSHPYVRAYVRAIERISQL